MNTEHSEKETARAALRAINPASIRDNVEYGVVIYHVAHKYGATAPFSSGLKGGLREQDILNAMQSRPKGSKFVALAHTHGRDEDLARFFSPEDIETARHVSVNGYLATPNGELVIFNLASAKDEFPRERL